MITKLWLQKLKEKEHKESYDKLIFATGLQLQSCLQSKVLKSLYNREFKATSEMHTC